MKLLPAVKLLSIDHNQQFGRLPIHLHIPLNVVGIPAIEHFEQDAIDLLGIDAGDDLDYRNGQPSGGKDLEAVLRKIEYGLKPPSPNSGSWPDSARGLARRAQGRQKGNIFPIE